MDTQNYVFGGVSGNQTFGNRIVNVLMLNSRSKRNYDVKKAEYDAEVNTARAAADLAYDLKVSKFLFLEWQPCHSSAEGYGFHQINVTTLPIL